MKVFMDIAYSDVNKVDKADFGEYVSNTKLRNLFNDLYKANQNNFVEKKTYAYMKLGFTDSNGNPIYAYFVPNTINRRWQWQLQGSRTEKEIFALQSTTSASEKIVIDSKEEYESPLEPENAVPKRNKPDPADVYDPSSKNNNPKPKMISSFDMISVRGKGSIEPFQIAKYPVVQKLYREIMDNNPSYFKDGEEDKRPVENVTWEDAIKFCNKLSEHQHLQLVYILKDDGWEMDLNANGYRLPTREEWLLAANGGEDIPPYKYSGSNNIQKVAWWQGDSPTSTHNVGDDRKKPNQLGLYDMSGNIWEWCWSEIENSHKCCGGAYNSTEEEIRLLSSKNVKNVDLFEKDPTIGFRLVKSNEEK
ncbi:SUMF1/EgtB/PvdO family nonheme iron enzyme [Treponema sp. OMZ 788]|uniref:SUMF1/EgtB/PvdO family nonheme iron enzyme n=1 Tax=Treponema sp. OMZ 788 TaxID=2563664 RepID=UPI0020A35F9C|nr:SUMF1/EgtB/PvdO family nonheme iron enzyme [Treponema sp. OMZ 788]UTC64530.1 SUMF1/EgtB/PvdO family nonheme iron enzyme [Treponema sp. OMZ 788]